jgi:hypothetical protein
VRGRELATGGFDVAAAREADGSRDARAGQHVLEALDRLPRGAVVPSAGRVIRDQVDLERATAIGGEYRVLRRLPRVTAWLSTAYDDASVWVNEEGATWSG